MRQWWDKLEILTITIIHQTQGGIQLFTGENQECQREPKTEHYIQVIVYNQNNLMALDVHNKQQNKAHGLTEKEVEHSVTETYQAQCDFS